MNAGARTLIALGTALALGVAPPAAPLRPPAAAQPTADAPQCSGHESITRLGQWFDANLVLTRASARAPLPAPTSSTYPPIAMRLLLRAQVVGDGKWRLVIRDPQQRTLVVLAAEDFGGAQGQNAERWTGILRTGRVLFDLQNADPTVRIQVLSGVGLPKSGSENVFSLQGSTPTWKELHSDQILDPPMQRSGEAVGMLQSAMVVGGAKPSWCCSGVMVSPTLFMTNWHCGGTAAVMDEDYWKAACDNAVIDLGWDGGTTRRQFSCNRIVAADKALDFVLISVKPVLGDGAATRAIPATLSLAAITAQEQVYLVHHAKCQIKLVSANCHVDKPNFRGWMAPLSDTQGPDLTHTCDSEPGSSGGALFDASGRLIGLHHTGFDRNAQCQATDHVNKAVRIGEIVAKLTPEVRAQLNIP
jgi:hypothetical protein